MPGGQARLGEVGGSSSLDIPPPAVMPWLQRGSGCTVRSGSGCSGVFVLSTHSLQCAENTKFLVRASYLEIYNEDVRDLLGPDTKQKLEVGAHLAQAGGAWGRREVSIRWCSLRSTGQVS